jgi:DNA repair protein RadD
VKGGDILSHAISRVNPDAPGVTLRPYQIDAIERVRAQIRAGKRAILLVLPTGGGKTVVASAVILSAYTRGKRVVFFAHRRELIKNTRAKLIAAGVPPESIGIMLGADTERLDAPVIVASIDTWRAREQSRPTADLVFVDEAHRSCSDTYRMAIAYYRDAGSTVLGLTATPFRSDGRGLGDLYEALEVIATPSQLIAEGFLCAPKVYSLPADKRPDLTGVRTTGGDYQLDELSQRMNTSVLVGGLVTQWEKHADGRRTVVFAVGVDHSRNIVQSFMDAGIAAEHLDGETPNDERDAILARLASGETLVVSNCAVLTEGWDCPAVKCCTLARPTKNPGLYLQMAGRILRPWEGVEAIILDHAGLCLAHGLPQDDREFALEMSRAKAVEGERPHKVCPSCDAVIATGCAACPECGHEFPPRQLPEAEAGDLVEITRAAKRSPDEYLRDSFVALVLEWQAENERRRELGLRPLLRRVIYGKFAARHGRKPPRGCVAPPDLYATPDEKRETYDRLTELGERYPNGREWARRKFAESFGHGPEVMAWT